MKPPGSVMKKAQWERSRIGFVFLLSLLIRFAMPGAGIEPLVSVSVNDSGDAQLFPGMPVLVSITLVNPTAFSTNPAPIVLASAAGPWTHSVRLDVLDASESPQSWPFKSNIVGGDTITLDSARFARLDRWLTPQQTVSLRRAVIPSWSHWIPPALPCREPGEERLNPHPAMSDSRRANRPYRSTGRKQILPTCPL